MKKDKFYLVVGILELILGVFVFFKNSYILGLVIFFIGFNHYKRLFKLD